MPHPFRFGFVCDPLDTFNRIAESSLFLMREIFARGHLIFVCEPRDLFLKQNQVWGRIKKIALTKEKRRFYKILWEGEKNLAELDCLFLRKDPPFDQNYLSHLWILSKLEGKILMINRPSALLQNNEKLSALDFPFSPKTLVSSKISQIILWAKRFRHGVVVKPLNESGGNNVFWIKKQSPVLKKLTHNETRPIICQEFLPAVKNGDKRILVWDGKMLGAFKRKPTKKGEFRANLHLGGRFETCLLTKKERAFAQKVATWCKKRGIAFAGLDMIGTFLTEINSTSPMGIREVNALYKKRVEKIIINEILCRKN